MKKITKFLPILLLIIPLGGCFITDKISEFVGTKLTETIIEQSTDEDVDVDLSGNGGMTIKTEDGETYIGTDATLPDDWPNDVSVIKYDEIITSSTYRDASNDSVTYQLSLISSMNYSNSINYYKNEMTGDGWTETASIDASGTTMLSYEKDNDNCGIWIMDDEDQVTITITITRE